MKNKQLILAGIVVLLIIAGGLYYFFAGGVGSSSTTATSTVATSTSGTKGTKPTKPTGSSSGNSAGSGTQSFAPSLEGVSLSVSPTSGPEPFTAKFSGTVPSSLNGSYTFSFVYGDGTTAAVVASCVDAKCTLNASHTYSIGGNFEPQLSATTKCATTIPVGVDCPHVSYVIAKTPVTVTGDGATASLVITPALAKAGETMDILVKGSGSSLKIDYGDGTSHSLDPMTNQIVALEHVYATAGTYTLKVTNGTETLTSQSLVVQ